MRRVSTILRSKLIYSRQIFDIIPKGIQGLDHGQSHLDISAMFDHLSGCQNTSLQREILGRSSSVLLGAHLSQSFQAKTTYPQTCLMAITASRRSRSVHGKRLVNLFAPRSAPNAVQLPVNIYENLVLARPASGVITKI
jgi:hypothetical protein